MEQSLSLRIGACFEIFFVSLIGYLGALYLSPKPSAEELAAGVPSTPFRIFAIMKAFSAGIILGLALIHLVNESIEILMEYTEFPMALCLVSAGIALQLTCEQAIQHYIAYYEEKHMPAPLALGKGDPSSDFGAAPAIESDESKQVELAERVEGGAISKKSFGPVDEQIEKYERTHAYIKAIGLECSIALHSIIIGFDLGLLGGDDIGTLRTMMAVLAVHQFFEGISLASVVLDTELAQWVKLLFGFIFAFTLPMGIMIGIGTSNQTSAGEYTRASFDAIAAGVLLYTALAELIVEDFNMPLLKNAHGTKMVMVFSFIVGIGIMALLVHFEVHDHDHDHEEDHEDHDDERRLSMIYVVESMLKSVF